MEVTIRKIVELIHSTPNPVNVHFQCHASDWVHSSHGHISSSSGPFYIVIGSPNYEDFNNWVVYANSSGFTINASTTTAEGGSQMAIIVPVTVNSQVQYSVFEYVNATTTGLPTTTAIDNSASSSGSATNSDFSGKSFGIGIGATLGFIILLSGCGVFIWRAWKLRKIRSPEEQVDVPVEMSHEERDGVADKRQ